MFGLSKLYTGLIAAGLVLALLSGCYGKGRHDGLIKGRAQVQAKWDAETAARSKAAAKVNASADQITTDIAPKAEAAQVRIETRYRTLVEKVHELVPPDADPVVSGDLVGLFDQAAAGGDPDAVSVTAGITHERAAPTHLSTLAPVVIANYGRSIQNSRQLSDLQAWVGAQKAANP